MTHETHRTLIRLYSELRTAHAAGDREKVAKVQKQITKVTTRQGAL